MDAPFEKDKQYRKFCAYGFLKNLRFFDAFLLLFFLENGISYSQIGALYAWRELAVFILEIPTGIVADTYGRKNSLLLAFLSYIISFVVFFFSQTFWLLALGMLLYGLGETLRSGTHKGMIMDYLRMHGWQKQKIKYYGHTRSWSQKGSALSALLAGVLVFYTGNYRVVFLFSIVPYLINLINVYGYPDELNHSLITKKNTLNPSLLMVFKNFVFSLKQPQVFGLINSSALHSAYLKAIKDYIQPIMVQWAIMLPFLLTLSSKKKSGIVVGILYFFIFLGTSWVTKNASLLVGKTTYKTINTTLFLGLASGALCGIFTSYNLWTFALLFFIVIYLIENVRKPILTGVLSDHVPNETLTSVLSAQSFYRTILTATIALGVGFMVDRIGLGFALVVVSAVLFVIQFLFYSRL